MILLSLLKNFLFQRNKRRAVRAFLRSRREILSGIKNYYIRDKDVDRVAKFRYGICVKCEHFSNDDRNCVIEGSTPCCSLCGCSLRLKVYSLSSSCPEHKWDKIISLEEEIMYLSKKNS